MDNPLDVRQFATNLAPDFGQSPTWSVRAPAKASSSTPRKQISRSGEVQSFSLRAGWLLGPARTLTRRKIATAPDVRPWAATGSSRGTVSNYLNEIERETGSVCIRGKRRRANGQTLQAARTDGRRNASIRDFHSFRVTWITLALAAGVPLELVQRVTGHRTVEVVMKHYFRPGREDFRQAIMKAMPKMLADGGQRSVKEEMLAILDGMTARTWKRDRERLLKLLGHIAG